MNENDDIHAHVDMYTFMQIRIRATEHDFMFDPKATDRDWKTYQIGYYENEDGSHSVRVKAPDGRVIESFRYFDNNYSALIGEAKEAIIEHAYNNYGLGE